MRNAELKEKSKDTHLNWEFGIWNAETRDLKTDNRGQKTEHRRQRTEGRGQMTESR